MNLSQPVSRLSIRGRSLRMKGNTRVHAENDTISEASASPSSASPVDTQAPRPWGKLLAVSFIPGAIGGTLLDGIHGTFGLLKYEKLPIDIDALNFHSSLWVPILLGSFYSFSALAIAWLDIQQLKRGDMTTALTIERAATPSSIALSYFLLAQFLALSGSLFSKG